MLWELQQTGYFGLPETLILISMAAVLLIYVLPATISVFWVMRQWKREPSAVIARTETRRETAAHQKAAKPRRRAA